VGSNLPPEAGIRVPPEPLRQLVAAQFEKTKASPDTARLLSELLVLTDLRGVHSHGTRLTPVYVDMMRQGRVNPRPTITVVKESPTTRVYDGDGGMGHIPCYQGTQWAIERAKQYGIAAVTTRNHFHFGGAGKYTRMAIAQDCFAIAVSSHRSPMEPDALVKRVNCTSPISVAFPSGEQPPLVVDMGASMLPWDESLFERMPFAFFKELGIGAMNRAFGGTLAGIYLPEHSQQEREWESNQGSFIAVFNVECFMPIEQFKSEMDRFIGQARAMRPFPGHEQAELPGGLEWQRERDYARDGIPISPDHQQCLQDLADELGIETPFAEYVHTRFGP
jgi:LDH2 family malate/lactate/ureidoglycolate dehydrogenase